MYFLWNVKRISKFLYFCRLRVYPENMPALKSRVTTVLFMTRGAKIGLKEIRFVLVYFDVTCS